MNPIAGQRAKQKTPPDYIGGVQQRGLFNNAVDNLHTFYHHLLVFLFRDGVTRWERSAAICSAIIRDWFVSFFCRL
jgi:hypothetical protein